MIYGLVGASGSGKTTLAKIVADNLDLEFVPFSTTANAMAHGYDPMARHSLKTRLVLQEHLLDDYAKMLDSAPRPMISDRTPIDIAAYLLAEIHMHSHEGLCEAEQKHVRTLVDRALRLMTTRFDLTFFLGALSTYEADPKRPAPNPAYHLHFELLCKGLLGEVEGKTNYVLVNGEDLAWREDYVTRQIAHRIDILNRHRKLSKTH